MGEIPYLNINALVCGKISLGIRKDGVYFARLASSDTLESGRDLRYQSSDERFGGGSKLKVSNGRDGAESTTVLRVSSAFDSVGASILKVDELVKRVDDWLDISVEALGSSGESVDATLNSG